MREMQTEDFLKGPVPRPRIYRFEQLWRIFFISPHGWHVYAAESWGDAMIFLGQAYRQGSVRLS